MYKPRIINREITGDAMTTDYEIGGLKYNIVEVINGENKGKSRLNSEFELYGEAKELSRFIVDLRNSY